MADYQILIAVVDVSVTPISKEPNEIFLAEAIKQESIYSVDAFIEKFNNVQLNPAKHDIRRTNYYELMQIKQVLKQGK